MIYIGIDPGLSGGIAALSDTGIVIDVWKMPATDRDVFEVLELLANSMASVEGRPHAMIERVHSQPKQGHVGAFTFGRGIGALHMALAATEIPFDQVVPAKWQQALGCLSRGDKNITKRRAQQLFPAHPITHAIADALLIAEYCRRFHRGVYGKEKGSAAQVHPEAAGPGVAPEDSVGRHQKGARKTRRARGVEITAAEARARAPLATAPRHGAGSQRAARQPV